MPPAAPAGGASAPEEQKTEMAQAEAAATAAAAAERECAFDRRLHLFALLVHSGTQLVSLQSEPAMPVSGAACKPKPPACPALRWYTQLPSPPCALALPQAAERAQRLASILLMVAAYVVPTAAPRAYMRWRAPLVVAQRLAYFAFPLLRQPKGIQRALDKAPSPGVRGVLCDLLRVAWGELGMGWGGGCRQRLPCCVVRALQRARLAAAHTPRAAATASSCPLPPPPQVPGCLPCFSRDC